MKKYKRLLALLLALVMIFTLAGCKKKEPPKQDNTPQLPPQQEQPQNPNPEVKDPQQQETPQNQPQAPPETPKPQPVPEDPKPQPVPEDPKPQPAPLPDKDGYYYDVENVVLYLHAYGKLPSNYITKSQAQKLGWEGGSVEKYKKGAAIGGDNFGNREGLLPKENGRKYTECDIGTKGSNQRGAKRVIFSNDGLYFYTEDHYESFKELTVNELNEIVWK